MIIIPSLDIHDGKSKYPFEGSYDPLTIIKILKQRGFHHFLITDLDGVFSGEFSNYALITELKTENVYLYVSGGIRSFGVAEKLIQAGADCLVVGTIAIKDQELLMNLINAFSERLCVAIDTYEDTVFIEGWVEESEVGVAEFVHSMALLGISKLIHTEINHTDNVIICSNPLMMALSKEHHIEIIPNIDVMTGVSLNEFVKCGCHEVIIGGTIDLIQFDDYLKLNV